MSIILAIETSSERASAALLRGATVSSLEAQGVSTHSQSLLPMVQQLLADAGMTLADCDAIAFGAGPGSFTGVRTACGIAQGLGFGAGKPLLPLVTLEAMAQACHDINGARDVLAVLDARMGEVYWAQYRRNGDGWEVVTAPTLSAAAAVQPTGDVVACGNGLTAYTAEFAVLPVQMPEVMPHAAQVASLGGVAFARGLAVAARDAEPLYLRNKVALTTSERLLKAQAAA